MRWRLEESLDVLFLRCGKRDANASQPKDDLDVEEALELYLVERLHTCIFEWWRSMLPTSA